MSQGISDNRLLWDESPAEVNGVPLYSIRMEHYMEWLNCKRALTVRQSTLPAAYAVMPYLSALYAMDFDTGGATGFMAQTITLLSLVTMQPKECFELKCKSENPREMTAIECVNGERCFRVEPKHFPPFRLAIAGMNGEELPDESQNTELVEAAKDIADSNATPLKADANDLLASVAYQCGTRAKELAGWTIREFEAMRKAIDRGQKFLLCGYAEAAGGRYKGGNPYPSWCFDRAAKATGMETLSEFTARTGMNVNVQNPDRKGAE